MSLTKKCINPLVSCCRCTYGDLNHWEMNLLIFHLSSFQLSSSLLFLLVFFPSAPLLYCFVGPQLSQIAWHCPAQASSLLTNIAMQLTLASLRRPLHWPSSRIALLTEPPLHPPSQLLTTLFLSQWLYVCWYALLSDYTVLHYYSLPSSSS